MKKKISEINDNNIGKIKEFILNYRAVFFIIGLAAASIIGVILLFNISNNTNVTFITRTCIKNDKNAFDDLETNTVNMLSATLEGLMSNEDIAARFLSRDREQLLQITRPVFEHLKNKNGITHWYFLNPEPEKTCFLRIHSPHKYNDVITRWTMDRCIKTKQWASGKELGKTALAVRAVHPYYYKGQLMGYIEMGVDIGYLLQRFKRQTGNEYGLLIRKEFLDRVKWASVTAVKNVRDNWNDMEHFLLVEKTSDAVILKKNHEEMDALQSIPPEGVVLERIVKDKKHFVRGIFPFYDAAGREVGGVFILKDITPMYTAMKAQKEGIVLIIILFMGVITFFMVFFHKRAEKQLRKYRSRLEEMIQEATAELRETNRRLNLEVREHKEAQRALEQECRAREEAEQKEIDAVKHAERAARMASIGVIAAGITHEINQPLNAIKVTADSIQYWHEHNPGALPATFSDQLSIISKSVKRIVEIIRHMRAFWVVPQTPEISAVNINKAVKNALSLNRQQLRAHGIQQLVKMDTDPLTVEGNLVHFEQIIVNLLSNAIHALDEKKTGDKKITVTTLADKKSAVLIIEDNGPGLPPENPDKLFDPFFSTNSSGEGMGLGLAIVKRYIERYKGEIEAANSEGAGARFTIKFPLHSEGRPVVRGSK